MKNNNTIFYIIGIIILVVVIANLQAPKETGMIGLTPHYYKDGVEVFSTRGLFGFSIVTPPGSVYDQISFDIYGSNEGNILITDIQIINADPYKFWTALQSGTTYSTELAVGETNKLLQTSGKMNTVDFEPISPVNFWVEVSGKNTDTGEIIYPDRSFSGNIEFVSYTPPAPSYWLDRDLDLALPKFF